MLILFLSPVDKFKSSGQYYRVGLGNPELNASVAHFHFYIQSQWLELFVLEVNVMIMAHLIFGCMKMLGLHQP